MVEPANAAHDQRLLNKIERCLSEHLELRLPSAWTAGKGAHRELASVVGYSESSSGRLVVSALLLVGDAITAESLRAVRMVALENSANLSNRDARDALSDLRARGPLKRTGDMSPEQFSELVAEHYRVWSRFVPHPVAAMAKEAGVKAPTVHSWIRDARLRGLLPPGRRGKK